MRRARLPDLRGTRRPFGMVSEEFEERDARTRAAARARLGLARRLDWASEHGNEDKDNVTWEAPVDLMDDVGGARIARGQGRAQPRETGLAWSS